MTMNQIDEAAVAGTGRSTDFVEALARGLRVLESFTLPGNDIQRGRMTLTEVAKLTNLTRGTARRLLLTLKDMNYVDSDGKQFWLTPRLLRLSQGFQTPIGLGDQAAALLHGLTQVIDESASVAILDLESIVYVCRVEVRRIYSSRIVNGTRLPAAATSVGRVLLASLSDEQLGIWLDRFPLQKLTPHTIVDRAAFLDEIARIRAQGHAILDQELEVGIRSVAVPIVNDLGRTMAALNASTSTARHSTAELREVFLPELLKTSAELSKVMNW